MGIPIPVEPTLDERSATAVAKRAEKAFADAGKNAGQAFTGAFSDGARDADQAVKKVADRASDAYDKARDAAGRLRAEEEKLKRLRDEGASNDRIVAQAERVEKARRAEVRAVRDATDAYREYEQAAQSAGQNAGQNFAGGLRGSLSGIGAAGQDAANEFVGGFAGSSALLRLGSAGGPIGLALAGVATLGVMGGRLLANGIADGLQTLQVQDLIATRMGLDGATMNRFGNAAGQAYANGWGQSLEDNLRSLQFGVQSGLIGPDVNEADAQKFIERIQATSGVLEEDPQQIARGVRNFVKTGLVSDYEQAFDLIVASTQKGLNISNDLLDTFEEYGTKFRDLGINGQEALGLINQLWEGGSRNVDVAADALKEFAITVVDNSDTTKTALTALGFDAEELGRKFAEGGPTARAAFGAVLDALASVKDPMEQERIGLDLFKTKWEDVGDAIKNLDLPSAANELGNVADKTDEATGALQRHADGWDTLGRNIDETFRKFKEWLADSSIGRFLTQGLPGTLNDILTGDLPAGAHPTDIPAPPAPPGLTPEQLAGVDSGQRARAGLPPLPTPGLSPDQLAGIDAGQRARAGLPPEAGPPPPPAAPPERGPGMPYDQAQQQVADAGRADSAKPSFDPSQYSVDAIPVPGAIPTPAGAGAPGVPMPGAGGGIGYYEVDPQRVYDAETSVLSARNSVESARIRVLELEAEGNATAQQLATARQQVTMAERQYVSAQMRLSEAQQGTWKKMENAAKGFSKGMDDIGAALDNDLGISEGLPGLADNLVRFVASLAAAPLLGPLSAISAANPIRGGHGILGILGARGAFGPQYTQSQYAQQGYGYPAGYAAGGYPGDAALLANVPAGRYSQTGIADLTQGIADCSSAVEDLVNLLDGRPTGGRSLSTHNADEWLRERGFLPGAGGPGDFRVGFNASHMQATLPGGTPFNWGSDAAAARRGIGGTGADDPAFTSHYYRPAVAGPASVPTIPAAPSVTVYPSTASASPSTAADIYSPANTNPALNNPATPATTPSSLPPVSGGGGTLPFMGQGGPQAAPFALNTPVGGSAFPAQGGGGFQGVSGLPMDAIMTATQGLDLLAPGASQAAQIGIKLANRAIGYAGQLAGIGVSGLMETFLPSGSPLGNIGNSWFGKVASGFAGARPALPNTAGQQAPPNPNPAQPSQPGQQQPGQPINLEYHNHQATEDRAGADITRHLEAQNAPAGQR
ncbi:tail length tape measure protein [Mycobacterium phage Che9c]|uniref:Phage tail tape measure protein domain-containing protein n=1 Tax=Mycobacterium phage Che9c TaxID=2907832 RepID=Q854Y3_9CAUD|nr:tail length tape measure protein [Mycobacterium phage Che9c]AAN12575.1 hypothetical protein PBI_CHE9C_15 [Mycobacterium phage Che9c]